MHELPVTESVLRVVLDHAERAGARRVVRVNLLLGELSSILGDSVQFYWDLIAEGTLAEGAELRFQRVPAELRCLVCGVTFPLGQEDWLCPACGSARVRVANGDQFLVESIEVE